MTPTPHPLLDPDQDDAPPLTPLTDEDVAAWAGQRQGAFNPGRAAGFGAVYAFAVGLLAAGGVMAGLVIATPFWLALETAKLITSAQIEAFAPWLGAVCAMLASTAAAAHFARMDDAYLAGWRAPKPSDAAFQLAHRLRRLPGVTVHTATERRRGTQRWFYRVTHADGATHHITLTDDGDRYALAYAAPKAHVSARRLKAALQRDRIQQRLGIEAIDPDTLRIDTEQSPSGDLYTTLRAEPALHTGPHPVAPHAVESGVHSVTVHPDTVPADTPDAALTLAILAEALCAQPAAAKLHLRDATGPAPALREDAAQTWQLNTGLDNDDVGALTTPTHRSAAYLGTLAYYVLFVLGVVALGTYSAHLIWGRIHEVLPVAWGLLCVGITSPAYGEFQRASPPQVAPRQTAPPVHTAAPTALTLSEGRLRLGDAEVDLSAPFQTHLTRAPGSADNAQTTLGITLAQGRAKLALRVPNVRIPDSANLPPLELDAPELDPDDARHVWDHVRAWASTHSAPPRWALASHEADDHRDAAPAQAAASIAQTA